MASQEQKRKISKGKEFLRTGTVDTDTSLDEIPLSVAAAWSLRLMAQAEKASPEEKSNLRKESREVLSKLGETDLAVLDKILNSEVIDKNLIVSYLQQRGITEIPLLTSTPPDVREFFLQFFSQQIIPAEQYDITDFGNVVKESKIPAWFREAQAEKMQASKENKVNVAKEIKDRWFIILTFMLAILTAYGFTNNLGIHLPEMLSQIDIFLSLYGAVTITRTVVQMERAEEWLEQTRGEIRTEYGKAFKELVDPDGTVDDPRIKSLFRRVDKTTGKSNNWDPFQKTMGLMDEPIEKKKNSLHRRYADKVKVKKQPSVLSELNTIIGAKEGDDNYIDRQMYINTLGAKMVERNFGTEAPAVAIVVPTYQTSLSEMKRLLISAKDQVYPVKNVYVVYNDNPNDPYSDPVEGWQSGHKATEKQATYSEFQELVDNLNSLPGRNDCQITLMTQAARGKREAMAMGFAMSLGSSYLEDLKAKYPDVDPEKLRFALGNMDLAALPNFRHDYIINIDSDTEIRDPFAVLNSTILLKKHPKAACTTGDVRVRNRSVNLLTEMTYQRYRHAFFRERAAQKEQVTCASGPYVQMESDALATILDEWYYQEQSGGIRSTYGDDRHLTTKFLENGFESLFCPDSAVETDSPVDWSTFLRQQLRWNKSWIRENILTLKFIQRLSKYDQFDIIYQQSFPFAMLYILLNIVSKGVGVGLENGPIAGAQVIAPYIYTIILYNELFSGVYGMLTNEMDPKYLLSPAYIDYHFGALLWLKIRAFAERNDTGWGTKGEKTVEEMMNIFQQNKGEIILEIHKEVVTEIKNPNFNADNHKPLEVNFAD